jgi:hypothetical protein
MKELFLGCFLLKSIHKFVVTGTVILKNHGIKKKALVMLIDLVVDLQH